MPHHWVCLRCGWAPGEQDGVAITAPALADRVSGFDPASFVFLASIEEGHFWFEPRNRLIAAWARKFFPEARSYLEIGCGTGYVLAAMVQNPSLQRVVGSELHPRGLEYARRRVSDARAEWIQMDARAIPAQGEFDLIGAYDVIEHIEEDEAVLGQAFSALRPGGGIVLAVPQHPWLWSATDDAAHHVRRYRRGELEEKLRACGFKLLASTSYTSVLLPPMMMARSLGKLRRSGSPSAPVNEHELKPSSIVNHALKLLLHIEVSATLSGARWPVGGSRVVAAFKPKRLDAS